MWPHPWQRLLSAIFVPLKSKQREKCEIDFEYGSFFSVWMLLYEPKTSCNVCFDPKNCYWSRRRAWKADKREREGCGFWPSALATQTQRMFSTWNEFAASNLYRERLLQSWIATTERDKMAGSHVYSHSPAIFLYFLLFSTCCEFMVLHTYLSKQAFLRYVVCDPTSSEAAESPPSKGSYLVDNYYLCWRFRRRCFFSFNSQIFSSVKMS